ncbi:beta-2-glycoprotein 1 isoform X1 [Gadus morhua]|uniref:beta-2-glycoprotein 1 isoform X1 n=1 Tax=Gadus morhua TaxID=8049 RepID=UPI0011B46A0B|nr:beta-2-glycoprotein 1-like isoform X1 [Gadus morhua]
MRLLQALLVLSPFLSIVKSENEGCPRPVLTPHVEALGLQLLSPPGTEAHLTCAPGYTTQSGVGVIICSVRGTWGRTEFVCQPKMCPAIDTPPNAEMHFEDNLYQSRVNFTCNEGYNLHGASSVVCQENAEWSASSPECKVVTCGPPPIPDNARIVYDIWRAPGGKAKFGVRGTYKCVPPMALIGNPRAECTSSGTWTVAPMCQMVTCPSPEPIDHGHMSSPTMSNYKDTIKYGCTGDYILSGNPFVQCLETGQWSPKPACGAPCSVDIDRGRILYNGRRLWIKELNPNKVFHNENVSFYCMNAAGRCGYAVSSQCINGTLSIPDCFEVPTRFKYITGNGLPSEITQC